MMNEVDEIIKRELKNIQKLFPGQSGLNNYISNIGNPSNNSTLNENNNNLKKSALIEKVKEQDNQK
jgi:hypothetical protein